MKSRTIVLAAALTCVPLSVVYAVTSAEPIAVADAGAFIGNSSVTIPWGAWVSAILQWAAEFVALTVGALAAYAGRSIPGWGASLIQAYVTQRRIENAVNYGLTQVNAAIGDKTVSISAANGILAAAEQYMLRLAPQAAAALGERLRPMLLAQIAKIGAAPSEAIPHALPANPIPQTRK